MNNELVPTKWKSQLNCSYKDDGWSLFAEKITRHPWVKQYLRKKQNNICPWCQKELNGFSVIHHISYEHKCCKPDKGFCYYDPCCEEPNRHSFIPNCNECNVIDFSKCISKLALVHSECNKEINDVQLLNYNNSNEIQYKQQSYLVIKTIDELIEYVFDKDMDFEIWDNMHMRFHALKEKGWMTNNNPYYSNDVIKNLVNHDYYKVCINRFSSFDKQCCLNIDNFIFLFSGMVPIISKDKFLRRYMSIIDWHNTKNEIDGYVKTTLLAKTQFSNRELIYEILKSSGCFDMKKYRDYEQEIELFKKLKGE